MKSGKKQQLLQKLNDNLQAITGQYAHDIFLCPICMNKINLHDKKQITRAHVIPDYDKVTFACRKCNCDSGKEQDKWFGDFLRSAFSKEQFLSKTTLPNCFMIDELKVNGEIKPDYTGNISLYMNRKQNSPEMISKYLSKFNKKPSQIQLSFEIPLLKNQQQVCVGFLTAGYLAWFEMFGYSWILQKHLDIVRTQIKNPTESIIKASKYFFTCKDVNWRKPWVGVIKMIDMHLPCFGFKNFLVIFPSRAHKNVYEIIKEETNCTIGVNDIRFMNLNNYYTYQQPCVLMFESEIVIAIDNLPRIQKASITILLTNESKEFMICEPDVQQVKHAMKTFKATYN